MIVKQFILLTEICEGGGCLLCVFVFVCVWGGGYYMGVLCVMRATLSKFHVSWGFGQSGLKFWGVQ